MHILEFLLAVILILGVCGSVVAKHLADGRRHGRQMIDGLERELRGRLDRLEAIEKRLAVLERIVTDRRYDLEQRFRDLEAS